MPGVHYDNGPTFLHTLAQLAQMLFLFVGACFVSRKKTN